MRSLSRCNRGQGIQRGRSLSALPAPHGTTHKWTNRFGSHLRVHHSPAEPSRSDNNASHKRLAWALLLLAHFWKEGTPEPTIPKISQDTLAEMVGTTRSRVRFFLTKFKKLGFIHSNGGLHIHSSLLNVVLHD